VGIYGVMAYSVAQRTREIGVRMALGAQRGDVLHAVLGPGLMPACLGLAMGIAVSMALARAAGGFLYGVGPADPVTYAGVCAVLLASATAASIVPARRALCVDPVTAMRAE
jgi:putative ABC transport system permease protein